MKLSVWSILLFIGCGSSFSVNRRDLLQGGSFCFMSKTSPSARNELPLNRNVDEPIPANQEVGILQETFNELYFYGPVNQRGCFELKRQIKDMDIKLKTLGAQYNIPPPPIHLHIQSQGGSLYHTIYIVDLIQSLDTDVYTYIDGFAASAATLISVVGKKRFMTKNSLMLVHQLSGSDSGTFNELQDQMSNMSILMSMIVNTYLEETNIPRDTLLELLKKDLWLDSATCLKYGLVDEVI